MSTDADRWDRRWAEASDLAGAAHPLVQALAQQLPAGAPVLDVAAGRGRQTRALVERGAHVTAVDVSAVGLWMLSTTLGPAVQTVVHDLSTGLPHGLGTFAAVVCVDYRLPSLWPALRSVLAPGGHLVVSMATVTNLERHARPSRRFLAPESDAQEILTDMEVCERSAAWRANGRHELWVWGVRSRPTASSL